MTLSQTADFTKRFIAISGIMLFLGIVSFTSYKLWHAYYIAHLPPIEEKPDVKFGILPSPDFPISSVSSSNFSYSLDTSTGSLPKIGIDPGFEKIIKVYFITKSFSTLLSSEKSQNLAQKFNINTSVQILSDTKYLFSETNKSLTVDLDTGNFSYYNETTNSAEISPDEDKKLVTDFKQTLNNLGVLTDDLKNGRSKITHLKPETATMEISLWPEDINQKLIVGSNFNTSLINATVTNSSSDLNNYLSLQFINFPIDTTTYATYPTKSADVAFTDLKSGKGVVILEPTKPQISISSIYLGYYLPESYTPYLVPIYIFEGPDFVAYVLAISDEFITQTK